MVVTQSEVQVHIRNQLFCAECRHVSVLTLMLFLATCFINGFYTVITIIMKNNAKLLLIVAVVYTVILLHFIDMLDCEINIYSQLLISLIRIVDISISNY